MKKNIFLKTIFADQLIKSFLKPGILLFINLGLSVPLMTFAHGPESGGGGGVVFVNQKPQLIDYFLIPNGPSILNSKYDKQSNSHYSQSHKISIKREKKINDPAFLLAKSKFEEWNQLPFDIIATYISSALSSPIVWDFQNEKPINYDYHFRPEQLDAKIPIVTAAYYKKTLSSYDVMINNIIWNELPLSHQAGLLIHESLRHVQISNLFYFDDESLQKATAIIMICAPTIKLNQYINFLLHNKKELAERNIGSFNEVTRDCWQ